MSPRQMLLSVVIPVYNEELTVGNVIVRVKLAMQQLGLSYELIVVNAPSYDRSLKVAGEHSGKLYSLKQHLGKGYALRAGFAQAKGDIIITIDSDGSHRPEELARVLSPVLKDKADLAIGSRYLNQKNVAARKLNAFGVQIFNFLIQLLTGTAITDSQSGYRAMKRQILIKQRLKSGGYE